MDPLVSIIIPNYNGEKYIERCVQSVREQSYKSIEVIIVDDGSGDASWKLITEIASRDPDIINACRVEHTNAAIARNHGMKMAKGRYVLFLDSDDILYERALETMIQCAEEENADLIIGNYRVIDSAEHILRDHIVTSQKKIVPAPMELACIAPNPSNKLYRRSVIRDFDVIWGNVTIGQDLNFYLKYLAHCGKTVMLPIMTYGWRRVQGSISNSYTFGIFDIAKAFDDVKQYYRRNDCMREYEAYITAAEYKHYCFQMEKQRYFPTRRMRKRVFRYFSELLKKIDLSKSENISEIRQDIKKSRIKRVFSWIYVSKFYGRLVSKKQN